MIEGHEDHGEAADEVDGGYSLIATIGTLEVGVWNGELSLLLRFGGILTGLWEGLRDLIWEGPYPTQLSRQNALPRELPRRASRGSLRVSEAFRIVGVDDHELVDE